MRQCTRSHSIRHQALQNLEANTFMSLQYITTGALKGFMTNLANSVHHISLAFLAGISAKSFDNIVDAAKRSENALPHLMLALARLSIVLSQFSAMAMATAVITVVGAAAQWPWIGLFLSVAMAASMLLRMCASLFLMTEFGGRGSVVSLVASLQSKSGRALALDPCMRRCAGFVRLL